MPKNLKPNYIFSRLSGCSFLVVTVISPINLKLSNVFMN